MVVCLFVLVMVLVMSLHDSNGRYGANLDKLLK